MKKITRENISQEVLDSKADAIIIEAATGVGKSLMAIKVQESMCEDIPLKYDNGELTREIQLLPPRTLVLIAERAHRNNWIEEYKKHDYEHLLGNTYFYCYASVHKLVETEWDLVICDEAHHLSPNRLTSLSAIESQKMLFLSATLKNSIKISLETIFKNYKFDSFKITTKEAIESEILPEPKIFIHELTLDNTKHNQVIVINGKGTKIVYCDYNDRYKYFTQKNTYKSLYIKCTQYEKYLYINEQVDYWKRKYRLIGKQLILNKWLRTASERKIFLGESKTMDVAVLLNSISVYKRFICFCTSIDQCNKLGCNNDTVVHSKIKDVEERIEKFQSGKRNSLFCVGMLKEGMNLSNIEMGIIVQLDGTELPFIQKFGRVLRAENPEIHIFYYKGTRDEEFLNNILEHMDKNYIKYIKN